MPERKYINIYGICPYLKEEHHITAEYIKVMMLGDPRAYARFVGCLCDYSHECGLGNDCPIIDKAVNRTIW